MTNSKDSPSPTKKKGACLHAASASDYNKGHRSWQAPFLCPGRARKRQALFPLFTYNHVLLESINERYQRSKVVLYPIVR
jgi:hypothetical protein